MTTTFLASELSPFSGRLRLAVALKKLDYGFQVPPGGSGSAELKTITPFGKVPALVVGDRVLVESLALLEYLEDQHPGTRSLRPADAAELARVRMISLLFDLNVFKAMGGVFAQLARPVPSVDEARMAFDEIEKELAKLVFYFDPTGPAVGGAWSIADCAMVPFAFLMDALAAGLGITPPPTQRVQRFAAWWADAQQLPEVAALIEHMKKALANMMAARKAAAAKQG